MNLCLVRTVWDSVLNLASVVLLKYAAKVYSPNKNDVLERFAVNCCRSGSLILEQLVSSWGFVLMSMA